MAAALCADSVSVWLLQRRHAVLVPLAAPPAAATEAAAGAAAAEPVEEAAAAAPAHVSMPCDTVRGSLALGSVAALLADDVAAAVALPVLEVALLRVELAARSGPEATGPGRGGGDSGALLGASARGLLLRRLGVLRSAG